MVKTYKHDEDCNKVIDILNIIMYFYLNEIVCTIEYDLSNNKNDNDDNDNLNISFLETESIPKFSLAE
jgi:hypothetical protein